MWAVKRKGRWEGRRKIIGQKKNELIVALYVWFWYLKIDYHPLVGLPKKESITICEFIVLPNKRWVCPASGRGANKKPTKLGGGIVTAGELGGEREDGKNQGRWDEN